MTIFLRLLQFEDKQNAIQRSVDLFRNGNVPDVIIESDVEKFSDIPGAPFSYWVREDVRSLFQKMSPLEHSNRRAAIGLSTKYDARFVRCYWEIDNAKICKKNKWVRYANGSKNAKFYADYYAVLNAADDFRELREYITFKFPYLKGNVSWILHDENDYGKPVIAWPLRTGSFSPHILPSGFVFSARTYAAYIPLNEICAFQGLLSSTACDFLIKLSLGQSEGQPEFVTSAVRVLPIPDMGHYRERFFRLAMNGWSSARRICSTDELSPWFTLPRLLYVVKAGNSAKLEELLSIIESAQKEIDDLAMGLYGLNEQDFAVAEGTALSMSMDDSDENVGENEKEAEDEDNSLDSELSISDLLLWCVGVAFGRFDWRLATGERAAPHDPDPFDPLPIKSPGMLPDDVEPLHKHLGILIDDPGHPHDLPRLIEEVLERVDMPVPDDVRRWLQKDFFAFHLQRYSKNRRKAPIYWPLSTTSTSYTIWLYYPSLTSQTLYTAINDFVEPKLKQVGNDVTVLRNKGSARSHEDEKQFETLQAFELELIELRNTLLQIAQTYQPNHDDGVQITAAPLWPLFRHKPWQKVLKDTWSKLEKGEYDWAHLAMNYWPERVREKCKTDKSLAIAHDLEELYVEPEDKPKRTRGKKPGV